MKYLRPTIISKLHRTYEGSKGKGVGNIKLVNIVRRTMGRKGHFVKLVVDRMVKPVVLYACDILGHKAVAQSIKESFRRHRDCYY